VYTLPIKTDSELAMHMGSIVLSAMEEVIGRGGVSTVLELASFPAIYQDRSASDETRSLSFEAVGRMQSALEEIYGQRGGCGVALRVGRVCFKYGLHEFGTRLGLTNADYRLLPLSNKLRVGSASVAEFFNQFSNQMVQFKAGQDQLLWDVHCCPLCFGRHTHEPACHLTVGFLQEFLYWASGGKIFHVEETRCMACGDEVCTLLIDTRPLA
jgi:predicted hydrocarbon binding protein